MIRQYMQRVQRILGDPVFNRFNPYDLLDYINEARAIVAAQGECVRVLCPSTAGLSSITLNAGGSGYTTAPTVTVSAPPLGVQPTAFAAIAGGAVVAVTINNPGSGFTSPPAITFSGGGGSSASATANLLPFTQIVQGQEVYNFADFNSLILSTGTGAASILAIRNIAVSWGSMKPMLRYMAWGDFQAYLRAYNVAAQGFSRVWSQYGRGSNGSFYLWPVPSQNAQMDLDCTCLPQDLNLDSDAGIEPISYPFTNAVPYKAAAIACIGYPDLKDLADRADAHFEKRMLFASAVGVSQSMIPDYYDPAARL